MNNRKSFIKTALMVMAIACPLVLTSCDTTIVAEEGSVTYNLLWGTKIRKLPNNMVVSAPKDGVVTVYKKVDGKIQDNIKVLMFTDFHLDHKKDCCDYTYTMIAKNIMNVQPDLVLLCGDNVTSTLNEPRAKQFCLLMESLNVYWSCCLGNHEGDQPGLTRSEMVRLFDGYPHCLLSSSTRYTSDGEKVWGDGNHAINVLNSKGEVAQTFFLLDSGKIMAEEDVEDCKDAIQVMINTGKINPGETEFYDFVKDSQIKWYEETMNKNNSINSTIISHVPLRDMELAYITYYQLYKDIHHCWTEYGYQTLGSPNIWPFTEELDTVENSESKFIMRCGHRAEDMCYSPHDIRAADADQHTPLFNKMLEVGGVHPAFFCGHDHQNNFTFDQTIKSKNKTITMGYIQPACYSSNNFWSKGYLARDPLDKNTIDKHHLIQGYSVLDYNLLDPNNPFEINNYTNYDVWKGEHYAEVLERIRINRKTEYKANTAYIEKDPSDPLKEELF